jgi:hypothetical protein
VLVQEFAPPALPKVGNNKVKVLKFAFPDPGPLPEELPQALCKTLHAAAASWESPEKQDNMFTSSQQAPPSATNKRKVEVVYCACCRPAERSLASGLCAGLCR